MTKKVTKKNIPELYDPERTKLISAAADEFKKLSMQKANNFASQFGLDGLDQAQPVNLIMDQFMGQLPGNSGGELKEFQLTSVEAKRMDDAIKQREDLTLIWQQLGATYGFNYRTARPSPKGRPYFMAEAT
jgi:hypothetical protein